MNIETIKEKSIPVLKKYGFRKAGKILGVRDNTIRKHMKTNGIDPKSVKTKYSKK
jgi:hypothetical protein